MTHEQLNSKNQATMETMEEPVFLNPVELENSTQNTRYLYERIWRESTLCVMHGPREVDKTDLAINIALDITKSKRSANVLFDYAESDIDMNPPKPEKKPRKASAKKDTTDTQAPTPPSADNADNATPFFRIKSGGANNKLATPLRR